MTSPGPGHEATGFLYPFIDAEERDVAGLGAVLARSARTKMGESAALRTATVTENAEALSRAATAMAWRLGRGGRLYTFGNGGSATDAEGMVALFRHPPGGRPLPAMSLVDDRAVLTALANDVGYDLVFARQLTARAQPGDVAVGFSTSGGSTNVLHALIEAARRDVLTVGLCGYDGGSMAASEAIEHCLVVRSDSVHRIQEAQDAVVLHLWSLVQQHLAGGNPMTDPITDVSGD